MIKWRDQRIRIRIALILLFAILLTAVMALDKMDMAVYPDQPLSSFTVRAQAPGMMPFDVNEQITRPLEEAIRQVGDIEKINAVSQAGTAIITVKVKANQLDSWREKLDKQLQTISKQLPVSQDKIQMTQDNLQTTEVGYYLLHGTDLNTLNEVAQFQIKDRLAQIDGISRVEVEAQSVKNKTEIVFRPSMLRTYGIAPGDIIDQLHGQGDNSQIGEIGEGSDKAYIHWENAPKNPNELGKWPISTNKGYVLLKQLADIRDLRGSQSENLSLYKTEPFIGIRVYAQDASQLLAIDRKLTDTIDEMNVEAQGRYTLTVFSDQTNLLGKALRDFLWFIGLAALLAAVVIGYWLKQIRSAILAFILMTLGIAWMLIGYWFTGIGLNLISLGYIVIMSLLFIVASVVLFFGLRQLAEWNQDTVDQQTQRILRPLLVAQACLVILMLPIMYTDVIQSVDKAAFYLAIPSLLWGIIGFYLVYGLIFPSVSYRWLSSPVRTETTVKYGKLARNIVASWNNLCELRYMPLILSLAATLLIVVFCKPFVITQPYSELITNETQISLEMVEGGKLESAFQAEKFVEEKLRTFPEVQDVYASISKEAITLHLKLIDRYDRTRSKGEYDKALKDVLLKAPGTKNYVLAGGEDQDEEAEFTVKGASLSATKQIADQLAFRVARYPLFTRLAYEDPFITEVKTSYEGKLQQIIFHPRADMLARYSINEGAVREQIQNYLGEQSVGSVRWGEQDTVITARFPENAMQHPDQFQNIPVRTPQGIVKLKDLVEWESTPSAESYVREDGLYIIKVTGKVNQEFTSAESVYAALPRIKEYMTLPTGYSVLTGEDVRKQEKEKTDEKDSTMRVLVSSLVLFLCCIVSAFGLRRATPAVAVTLMLPLFACSSVLGLLIVDRPLTMMSMYGVLAVVGITLQLAFWFISELEQGTEGAERTDQVRRNVTKKCLQPIMAVVVIGLIAILPLTLGWGNQEDFHAPFAATFSFGILMTGWILLGLLPGMYLSLASSSVHETIHQIGQTGYRLRTWWQNEQIRRQDARSMKQQELLNQKNYQEILESQQSRTGRTTADLTPEDFLPLSNK